MHSFTKILAGMAERFDNDVLKVVHENLCSCSIPVSWVLRLKGLSLVRNQGILKLETGLQLLCIRGRKNQCQIHIFIIMFALKEAFKKLNFHILGGW